MMKRDPRSSGFTLFELLVVLAVMSVVSTIGVTAYTRVTNVWRISAMRMELGATAEDIFRSIRLDMNNIVSAQRTGQAIRGIDVLSEEHPYKRVPLDDDRFILPILQAGANGINERLAVKYHISYDGGLYALTRTLGPMDGSEPGGASQVIATSVLAMDVEYLSDGAWKAAWTDSRQPDAIRVHITLMGANQWSAEQITRSAVFPVYVK